jgi:hypothetical protein
MEKLSDRPLVKAAMIAALSSVVPSPFAPYETTFLKLGPCAVVSYQVLHSAAEAAANSIDKTAVLMIVICVFEGDGALDLKIRVVAKATKFWTEACEWNA